MSIKKFPIHLILLARDNDVLPLQVMEHEIPIINALHGAGRVTMSEENYTLLAIEDSATDEYTRLVKKWEQNSRDAGLVAKVYPTISALAAATDLADDFNPLAASVGPVLSGSVDLTRDTLKAEAQALAAEKAAGKKGKKAA